MSQISSKLRSTEGGIAHWCPGCEGMHIIPDRWQFDGNLESPTFSPSVKITYNGPDAGQTRNEGEGEKAPSECCHYNLTAGNLVFHGDCTHELKGQTVPLPILPESYRDA